MPASGQTGSASEKRTFISKRNYRRRGLRFRSGLVGRFNEAIVEFATRTLKASPAKITKIWAIGERAHSLLADSGLNPAGLLSVPISINAYHAARWPDSDRNRSGPRTRRCREGLCLSQSPQNRGLLRSGEQTAPATRSRLARQASRNALAHEDSAGSD